MKRKIISYVSSQIILINKILQGRRVGKSTCYFNIHLAILVLAGFKNVILTNLKECELFTPPFFSFREKRTTILVNLCLVYKEVHNSRRYN